MSSKTWRNAISRRIHKERAQPSHRKSFGLLEKKKDYKKRAKDYHRKADHIKLLKEKAALKNPDEFYFAMHNSRLENGVHINVKDKRHNIDTVRKYTAQDVQYLHRKKQEEEKKINLLKSELHGISQPLANNERQKLNKHTIFVESVKEFKKIDNENESNDNESIDEDVDDNEQPKQHLSKTERKLLKKRRRRYAELAAREERQHKIQKMITSLQQKKNLINSKGKCIKMVKRDKFGDIIPEATVYKWKKDRQR